MRLSYETKSRIYTVSINHVSSIETRGASSIFVRVRSKAPPTDRKRETCRRGTAESRSCEYAATAEVRTGCVVQGHSWDTSAVIPGGSIAGGATVAWRTYSSVRLLVHRRQLWDSFLSFPSSRVSRRTRHLEHVATTLAGT